MTGQTVDRCLVLVVAVHAVTHRHLDVPLGDRLLGDVAMAGRTFDVLADVRGVIELDVRLGIKIEDPFPGHVDALLTLRRDLLNERPVRGDGRVTGHARAEAWNPGNRSCAHVDVAVLGALDALLDVRDVGELKRLDRVVMPVEVVRGRVAEARVSGGEDAAVLTGHRRELRCRGRCGISHVSAACGPDDRKPHEERPDK